MGFVEAISSCFNNYVGFEGRAPRSEYWFWVLFVVIVSAVLRGVGHVLSGGVFLSGIFDLVVFLPGLAVAVRRMHDVDKSGWFLLVGFIPVIGWLVLLYFAVQPGTPGPNRFGPPVLTI
jgi:uncharacterized membrane protein YhaH (DUF805 family)